MREAFIAFAFALIIGSFINGYQGAAINHTSTDTLQQPESQQTDSQQTESQQGASEAYDNLPSTSQSTFTADVLQSETPVLVEFWATWCGPCKRMKPVIETLAKEYDGRVKVVKVDVDKEGELANKFNVAGVPTFIIFKNGKVMTTLSGVMTQASLDSEVDKVL